MQKTIVQCVFGLKDVRCRDKWYLLTDSVLDTKSNSAALSKQAAEHENGWTRISEQKASEVAKRPMLNERQNAACISLGTVQK